MTRIRRQAIAENNHYVFLYENCVPHGETTYSVAQPDDEALIYTRSYRCACAAFDYVVEHGHLDGFEW